MPYGIKTLALLCAVVILSSAVFGKESDSWVHVQSQHFEVVSNASETEARRIASQFEQIRAVFQGDFPSAHLDLGRPFEIIAVKDENSLKTLLPDYWGEKGRVHPSGMYITGEDISFSVLRTDASGGPDNPYFDIYQQYAAAILQANYTVLPLWTRYGIADFYGNTIVESNQVRIGVVPRGQLNFLQKSTFIPFNQLFIANAQSAFLNDQNTAGVFNAESWAIVHYLRMDPQASKQGLLNNYLKSWVESGDPLLAATQTFGDLQKFQNQVSDYVHRSSFYENDRHIDTSLSPSEYLTRQMSLAEALVVEADFLEHRGKFPEARQLLNQAQQLEPNLASLHARLGNADLLQFNNDDAQKELAEAISGDPKDFRSLYGMAVVLLRKGGYGPQNDAEMVSYLEKVVQIDPTFAPAYAFLSVVYRQQPDTQQKALEAALKANQLYPAALNYLAYVGDALIALNRDSDARVIGDKLVKAASSPAQKQIAQSYEVRLAHYEQNLAQKNH